VIEPRDALRRYPLLAVLGPRLLDDWIASGVEQDISLGDTLLQAGTPGTHAFLVLQGSVRVVGITDKSGESSIGKAGPGDLLGEYALVPPGKNTATCRAAGAGKVLRLELALLRETLDARAEVGVHVKRWLRLHALLGHRRGGLLLGFLSAPSLQALLDRCEIVSFRAGRTIQADGLSADRWFVIESGEVCLHAGRGDPQGEPVVLGPGDAFGEMALLGGRGLPQAVARAETECLSLRREAFYQPLHGGAPSNMQSLRQGLSAAPRSYPWVRQESATDCGVAALAMVARFHGRDVGLLDCLRRVARVRQAGTSLLEVQRAAALLGFHGHAVRLGVEELTEAALPAVAHLTHGHFVVVYAAGQQGIVVGDPAVGVVTLAADAFRQTWSGNLLLLLPQAGS
jgi:CRP-like cAMP-binding protein